MNERIKELWVEATKSSWPRPGKITAGEYDYNLEKFAELLVKECANVGFNAAYPLKGVEVLLTIKKHFGVKE